jgi:hypothetical protein
MRRLSRISALAALVALLTVQPAAAAQPIIDKGKIDVTRTQTVCGVEVTTHIVATGVAFTYADGSFMYVRRFETTYTNAEGDWVTEVVAGRFRTTGMRNPDGTVTFRGQYSGIQSLITTSDGTTAAFNRGRIIFRTTIDRANETFVSEVVFEAGHHIDTEFCEILDGALG